MKVSLHKRPPSFVGSGSARALFCSYWDEQLCSCLPFTGQSWAMDVCSYNPARVTLSFTNRGSDLIRLLAQAKLQSLCCDSASFHQLPWSRLTSSWMGVFQEKSSSKAALQHSAHGHGAVGGAVFQMWS